MNIKIYNSPRGDVVDDILSIVKDLTGKWFTKDVAPATRMDLLFQHAACVWQNNRIRSFIMFTSHDGSIEITLMGTSPEYHGQGFGSALIGFLGSHAKGLGFTEMVTFTVPPASKPIYKATVDFYKKHGFKVTKEYTELWQSGALELRKSLDSQ